jgi:hypothetical protein
MTTETFPTAIVSTDDEPSGLLILVNEAVVDLYGAITVYDIIASNTWVVDQDLPIAIAWNLDDDPKVYSEDEDLVEFVASTSASDIPWDYELTLDLSDMEEDEDDYEDDDEDEDDDYEDDDEEEDDEDE